MGPITLCKENTVFLMIDIQEKLIPAIHNAEQVIAESERLLRSAAVLNVPVIATEQYPKGLGGTLAQLVSLVKPVAVLSKTTFSCCEADGFDSALEMTGRKSVVIFGVETHICVFTTAMSLARAGYQVIVAGEACGSRKTAHHDLAVSSMLAAGIAVLPVETIVYQLLGRAGTPEFKALLPFFK